MPQNVMSLSEQVYEAIRTIEQQKREDKCYPASALLIRELAPRLKLPPSAIYPICVLLYKAERITGGRTINDSYFNTR